MPPKRKGDTSVEGLAGRLHSTAIHLLRRLRREDVHGGLTGPRASALSVLVFAGPRTQGELAAAEQVRPPTMTRLVRALEIQGLVTREPDATDGRAIRVRVTRKGKALLLEGRDWRVRRLGVPLTRLKESERRTLTRAAVILERVVREL